MATEGNSLWFDCLVLLLRPVMRFALKRGLSFSDTVSAAKLAIIRVAEEELKEGGYKPNPNRISVMTGLYRREVTRIYKDQDAPSAQPPSVVARVIGQWEQDARFRDPATGTPKNLTFNGPNSEFYHLVTLVSKNVPPGTVLLELERAGTVVKVEDKLKLARKTFSFEHDPRKRFDLLTRDVETLLNASLDNMIGQRPISNLHVRTEYDNIVKAALPEIERWLVDEGKEFHRRARDFISKYDQDIYPAETGQNEAGARVTLTAFSLSAAKKS